MSKVWEVREGSTEGAVARPGRLYRGSLSVTAGGGFVLAGSWAPAPPAAEADEDEEWRAAAQPFRCELPPPDSGGDGGMAGVSGLYLGESRPTAELAGEPWFVPNNPIKWVLAEHPGAAAATATAGGGGGGAAAGGGTAAELHSIFGAGFFDDAGDFDDSPVRPDRGGLSVRLLDLRAGDPAHSTDTPPPTCQRTPPPPPPSSSRMGPPPQTPPSGLVGARQLRSARARRNLGKGAPSLLSNTAPSSTTHLRLAGRRLGRVLVALHRASLRAPEKHRAPREGSKAQPHQAPRESHTSCVKEHRSSCRGLHMGRWKPSILSPNIPARIFWRLGRLCLSLILVARALCACVSLSSLPRSPTRAAQSRTGTPGSS